MRSRAIYTFKCLVAYALYFSGVFRFVCRWVLRDRAVVLMYHRVLPSDDLRHTWSHPGIIVTRQTFERQLQQLKRHFRIISLQELVTSVESGKPFAEPSCLITFDDGWLDTYTEAGPLLRRHGLPAVVFLPVDFIGGERMFWQEDLSSVLYRSWQRAREHADCRRALEMLLAPYGASALLNASADNVRDVIARQVTTFKTDGVDVMPLADALRARLARTPDGERSVDAFMTWDQVRLMASDGISFGAHGTTHQLLTRLKPGDVVREVEGSKECLERELGVTPMSFSYPNGDWTPEVAAVVRDSGFRVSFSTARGFVSPGDAHRFSLRRVNVHEDMTRNAPMFLARILGLF